MNPNDAVRAVILRYFYDRNASATSHFGKKGSAAKISTVKTELKALHGLVQREVVSNLTYLIDRSWIKTFQVAKTVTVSGGSVPSTVTWYEITAAGIDRIEGDSEFKPQDRFAGINITASGSNVIALGDGNIVNQKFQSLHEALDGLKAGVTRSNSLTDPQKLDVVADIETLKDQLAKPEPNQSIVRTVWSAIKVTVTATEFGALVAKVAVALGGLIA